MALSLNGTWFPPPPLSIYLMQDKVEDYDGNDKAKGDRFLDRLEAYTDHMRNDERVRVFSQHLVDNALVWYRIQDKSLQNDFDRIIPEFRAEFCNSIFKRALVREQSLTEPPIWYFRDKKWLIIRTEKNYSDEEVMIMIIHGLKGKLKLLCESMLPSFETLDDLEEYIKRKQLRWFSRNSKYSRKIEIFCTH